MLLVHLNRRGGLFLKQAKRSCALPVHDGGTVLLVILFGDQGFGEGAERGESGGTLPDGELTVIGDDESDLGVGHGTDLSLQTVSNTIVHGATTGEDDIL